MAIDLREQVLINKFINIENKNEGEIDYSSNKSLSMKQKEIDDEFDNLDITKY